MRLDATHRNWLIAAVLITSLAAILYVRSAQGPGVARGDTPVGLTFGLVAAAMIFFAGFLGARKKLLLLRIGSLTWWMRGHLWLGLLSLPIALFHSAFSFGHGLTSVLTWLLIVVVVSGIFGAVLQHGLPGAVTAQVRNERTYEQLDHIRRNLRLRACEAVAVSCGPSPAVEGEMAQLKPTSGHGAGKAKVPSPDSKVLADFYAETVLPYLRGSRNGSTLAGATAAGMVFDDVRTRLDPGLHDALERLADVCAQCREQDRQRRLHLWLHGWLLLHIPISMALMVLVVVHAVMALYY